MKCHPKKRSFFCGTGCFQALYRAQKEFHQGLPTGDSVIVEDVKMTVFDDWAKVGTLFPIGGEPVDVICPRVHIDGEAEDSRLMTPDEIKGFLPERGQEYRLLVRRFSYRSDPFYRLFELIEVL